MSNKNKINVPDFLIVGAAKSGTSSLHSYLKQHPQICMPTRTKELRFWHTYRTHSTELMERKFPGLPKSPEEYLKHFEGRENLKISGEVSPAYLYCYKETVENLQLLKEDWNETKIIIILREPLDKIWSQYKFVRNQGLDPKKLSLEQGLKEEHVRVNDENIALSTLYVGLTKYYSQVKYYFDHFKNVKILLYDDLKKDSQGLVNELTDYLEVERMTLPKKNQIKNASRPVVSRVNPLIEYFRGGSISKIVPLFLKRLLEQSMAETDVFKIETQRELAKLFKPEIEQLNRVIEPDLSRWLEKYDEL